MVKLIRTPSITPFRVGLLLTKRCNAMCCHCWFDSGPTKTATMTLSEAKNYIHQAKEFSTLEWISFTGGEPFLLPDMLIKLVSYVTNLGLRTECVTNGYWAYTERIARKKLSRFMDAGLDVINISVDDFHQEFIPFERIHNCFNAAKHLGLKVVIMCVISQSSKLRASTIIERLGDDAIHLLRSGSDRSPLEGVPALLVETGVLPAGRATTLPFIQYVSDQSSSLNGGCPFILRDIAITPEGRVLPCCSVGALTDSLAVGNVKLHRLAQLIEAANKHPLVKLLAMEGPSALFRRLDRNSLLEMEKYTSKCHLCFEVLSDPRINEILYST